MAHPPTTISKFVKEIWKWINPIPTELSKGLSLILLCSLFAVTFFIIFKAPSAADYGLFSRFLHLQPPTQAASKTNITEEYSITENIINSPPPRSSETTVGVTISGSAASKTNITEEYSIGENIINITKKTYTYDKLLGGLLPEGFEESSCLSRYRWNFYRKTPPGGRQPSSYLISKLRKYEALHKQCGPKTSPYNAAVDLLYNKKKKRNNSDDGHDYAAACRYVIWNPPPGLGNRMLSLASAFLYALLTDRVLLLRQERRGSDMSDLFCEPFPETTWLLPQYFRYGRYKISDQSFRYRFGNMVASHSLGKGVPPPIMYVNLLNHYEDNDNDKRFFCDEDQTHLEKVTWMVIASNQYFAPALFLIPSFQQELDNLFPEKQTVFHHLGRYLFHPTNAVWGLITRYHEGYLSRADEKIGIQIRVFNEKGEKGPLKHVLEEILGCTTTENLLPKLQGGVEEENHDTPRNLAVLVTSLRSGYYEELRNIYWQNATISGDFVAFYQPSHEELQQSGNQMHDMKALAEIYLLSLTDKLVVSRRSTFGYVAHSLGGLQPWILHPQQGNTFCKHSLSMEPCFHYPPSNLVCGNNAPTIVAFAKNCEDVTRGLKFFDKLA